ncbi:unnamed protein product [Mytilus coruscus]|uniref:Uncharacterized protein n=1 Tax=Mytilus coruscus TaxID=42192 RepID=A0A6J8A099_MYTCO|nr:unnamed protein product [Mytilus coruscus]
MNHLEENHEDELSLFSPPPANTGIQRREWIEFRPTNQITGEGPLIFSIPPQSAAYMDLKRSSLKVKLRLTNADGTSIAKDANVGLVNLPLHSIFSEVECSLQQTPVAQMGSNYPYKAYIDTILESGADDQVHLTSQFFHKDSAGHFDDAEKLRGRLKITRHLQRRRQRVLFGIRRRLRSLRPQRRRPTRFQRQTEGRLSIGNQICQCSIGERDRVDVRQVPQGHARGSIQTSPAAMNKRGVERALKTHHVKAICADELIRPDRPETYVVNTDICARPGTHWTVFHFPEKGPPEFFDSLGHRPGDYRRRFERVLGSTYLYTPDAIQPEDRDICGAFCIHFVRERHRSRSFQDILKDFSTEDLPNNDRKVKTFIRERPRPTRQRWSVKAVRTAANDGK